MRIHPCPRAPEESPIQWTLQKEPDGSNLLFLHEWALFACNPNQIDGMYFFIQRSESRKDGRPTGTGKAIFIVDNYPREYGTFRVSEEENVVALETKISPVTQHIMLLPNQKEILLITINKRGQHTHHLIPIMPITGFKTQFNLFIGECEGD